MARVVTPFCGNCGTRMTRFYVRPTGDNTYRPIGFLCNCGSTKFDDKRTEAFERAWQHLKRGD